MSVIVVELGEGVDHPASQQRVVAHLASRPQSVRAGQQVEQAVKRPAEKILQATVRPASLAGVDDVEAGLGRFVQLGNVRRIVLQVAVHHDDVLASRRFERGGQSVVLAEIPTEADPPHPRISLARLADAAPRVVGATVVDEDDLVRRRDALDVAADTADELLDEALTWQERTAAGAAELPGMLPEVLYDLAVIRLAAGHRESAAEALERAIALNPKLRTQAEGDGDLAGLREPAAVDR